MTTALISHPDCLNHITPAGHPERVARLEAIHKRLEDDEYSELMRLDAPLAQDEHILYAHSAAHLNGVVSVSPDKGIYQIDGDTSMSPGSLVAARRAAGAQIRAVDLIMQGQANNAFCAVRPPGHHAEDRTPMGFCLFGNVVIGARHALNAHGLARVAIADFDVHHGNGTQALVWDDARILFASTHQMPLYPGSGAATETGAHGNIVNAPLAPYSGSADFRAAFERIILPALEKFSPEMIFISAGFDAHADDPLANLKLTEDDFAWATQELCAVAKKHCRGRIVSTLEGGYDLAALANSVAAHVKVLMETKNE